MTHHRPEWIWYVASFVVESRIEGVFEPIVLIESILLRAESPEAVFIKAASRCASSDIENEYRNKFGEVVSQRYLGIHDIEDLQTEQPEDELVLQVRVVSNKLQVEANSLVRTKNELSLFGGQRPEFSRLNQ